MCSKEVRPRTQGITRRGLGLSLLGYAGAQWLANSASAAEAELHLVLAFDASASVNDEEFHLQRAGTARALRDPSVMGAIAQAPGGIAISLVQWASIKHQVVALTWTRLSNADSVFAFSRSVDAMPRKLSGGNTMIHAGLAFAARQFANAPGSARRRVIDLSGNGPADDAQALASERRRLISAGLVINALAIEELKGNLTRYYEDFLIGGSGAFVQTALEFSDFEDAMRQKLLREIKGPALS